MLYIWAYKYGHTWTILAREWGFVCLYSVIWTSVWYVYLGWLAGWMWVIALKCQTYLQFIEIQNSSYSCSTIKNYENWSILLIDLLLTLLFQYPLIASSWIFYSISIFYSLTAWIALTHPSRCLSFFNPSFSNFIVVFISLSTHLPLAIFFPSVTLKYHMISFFLSKFVIFVNKLRDDYFYK